MDNFLHLFCFTFVLMQTFLVIRTEHRASTFPLEINKKNKLIDFIKWGQIILSHFISANKSVAKSVPVSTALAKKPFHHEHNFGEKTLHGLIHCILFSFFWVASHTRRTPMNGDWTVDTDSGVNSKHASTKFRISYIRLPDFPHSDIMSKSLKVNLQNFN